LPASFTATAIFGAGWSCTLATLTCTRSDSLAVAALYPVITVIVNVGQTSSLFINQVSVSGGGSAPATGSDPTGVQVGEPVTIQTVPAGLPFSIDGDPPQIAPVSTNLTQGGHTLAVSGTQAGAPGVRYIFSNWNDGGAASHSIYIEPSAAAFTATFQTQYQLNLFANPVPGGTITPVSGAFYNPGTLVGVSATANPPYIFDGWSGDTSGTDNSFSVTLNGPLSVTATFSVPGFTCAITGGASAGIPDVQMIVNEALGAGNPADDLNRDKVVNVVDIQKLVDAAIGLGCIY